MPVWSVSDRDEEILAIAVRALQAWADGEPPRDPALRPDRIPRIHEIVSPALRAAAWPRWLLLERAFLDASATGDLLFAALVLRTLCEEAMRLHALDIDANRLAILAESTRKEDQDRLKQFVSFAWASLARLSTNTIIEGGGWPSFNPTAKALPRLERARAALNSYVHPNYGSHIVALYPERSAAATLLLEAVAAVYEAFFALSWSEKKVAGRTLPVGVNSTESWKRTTRLLLSDILPEIRRTAENDAVAEVMKAPAIVQWLATERNDLAPTLRDPALVPLLEKLPRWPRGVPNARESEFRTWEGAHATDVLGFAAARRGEERVVSQFPAGAPDTTDQVRWLRFNALCLQLAMLIDQAKAASFKVQLVRQVVQGNSLAALLCVRSLIEHRALAVWLPHQVGSSLDAVASQIQADGTLPELGRQAETALANFLAGQGRETREERRAWVMSEQGGARVAWLNLKNIVETAFAEDDRFRTLYALSSAAMHARSYRGIELLLRFADVTAHSRHIGLLVLERLCNRNEEMDHLSAAAMASNQMDHAAAFGGAAAAATDRIAQQVFGHFQEVFVQGLDYSGDGTNENPFYFEPHLEYYKASYALLAQLGVSPGSAKRILDHDVFGHLCDKWHGPDREYWFKVPLDRDQAP
ncbi:hypothetical protein [Mesorhizobium sp.]|uniref:hypothetical protein n=2 Tax=unclassified Mesorhizobium TaxID=325217 RepID=UPI000FD1A813|nr:hypothetical protein [Mesorhizobium sp.]RUV90832.1 hypothetical protein EOA88_11830 [Mesorhizobium sp. M5C.F.Ca.IN.020.14.1.1]RWG41066.1 MAG: hypothetical protein EOQ62_28450 [Mesorhizobium sp.]RWH50053.1 MAG: hypothetical protein EOQ82_31760 [Mesorhizobium sp.]RWI67812.1 MAG: hypothetical protein EOR18_23000 [Mesorhizobium sp.]RWI77767.1 MAG: hypothetical protein EOR19_13995 [Mesorhizobium sp.]